MKILSPSAQRFYEIVSFKIYAAIKYRLSHAKLPYSEYCTYSAQQRYFDFDHVKKQMYKVHKPHLVSGYLSDVSIKPTTDSDGKPDWVMSYVPGPKARAEFKAFNDKRSKNGGALDAEVLLPLETSEESANDDARDLVAYFHTCFGHADITTPTAKDLDVAADWISQYGIERSRFIVEYSQEAAAATKYAPDMLVGIRKYVDPAIKKFDAREKHRQVEQRKDREAKLQDRYRLYRNTRIQEIESALSARELDGLKAAIREKLLVQNPNPEGLGLGIQMHLDSELAERAGVPPYEEWRAQHIEK